MAKAKKTRVDGGKKAHDPRAKDLEAPRGRAVVGGKGTVNVSELTVTKTTDVSSTNLFR